MPIVIWSTIFFYPLSSLMCCVFCCNFESVLVTSSKQRLEHVFKCLALIKACDCSLFNKMLLIQDIWEGASHTICCIDMGHLMLYSIVCKSALVHFCVHTWVFLGRLIKELVTLKDWKMFLRAAHNSKCQKIICT